MFGQPAGRSVFNTPTGFTHFRPIFGLLFENVVGMLTGHSFLAPPFFVAEQAAMLAARVFFWQSCTRGRLGALSNDAYPIADNEAPRWHARF